LTEKRLIYLDWNATAPTRPQAVAAMADAAGLWANPSSVHGPGRAARAMIEDARERIATGIGVFPDQLVFTSGGTEAAALVMRGMSAARRLVSAIEHDAVLMSAPDAALVRVGQDGIIDLDALRDILGDGQAPALVALMHANNETGVLQPIEEAYELVQAAGGTLFVDAVQTAGKRPLPPADFLAVSAHKLGGPPGIGAVIARCATGLHAVQKGGGQERGLRGGTENLPGIMGFAAAIANSDRDWLVEAAARQNRMEARLKAAGGRVFAERAERLPNTSLIRMPGVAATTQLISMDLQGFAVSAGSACSSGKVGASHVLSAMGVAPQEAGEAIRISTGWTTTDSDIDDFCTAWEDLAARRVAA
tara:strand:- start:2676 stop:3764 length:1089 start_codon:yes stop_codon:yes gene_type:complete